MEIFKMSSKLGIKPKDIIGMGGDIVKMGKSLFNTRVNPKLLDYVNKRGELPGKILEDIKIHMRSMKNASESQIEVFKLNLKDIFNAKFPPPPVSSVKEPATSVKNAAEAFKGWQPTVIKGGKDKLATGGIAKLNSQLNQLPEYYLPMAKGGLPKGPAGITSLNGWGSTDESQNVAGADISASMDKNPNDPGWGGGNNNKPPKPPVNIPKGPTAAEIEAEKKRKQLAEQQREYARFYNKFKGDTKKKTNYLETLLKKDPLLETYKAKGLLDWDNLKTYDDDINKLIENTNIQNKGERLGDLLKLQSGAWGYTRPWSNTDDSLYIANLKEFGQEPKGPLHATRSGPWNETIAEKNKRIAETIGHEARHQVLGEGWGTPHESILSKNETEKIKDLVASGSMTKTEGAEIIKNLGHSWAGDPYSQKVDTNLADSDVWQNYKSKYDSNPLNFKDTHELVTTMGDFQSYNNPTIYDDIYETVHGGMPRHLTSNVANELYDASEKFAKDTSARTVGEKYENIDPVIIEGYVNQLMENYPEDTEGLVRPEVLRMLKQEADDAGTKEVMDVLKDDYSYVYAKGGIANHFRNK